MTGHATSAGASARNPLAAALSKYRHGTLGIYLLDRLEPLGVLVRPFFVVEEGLSTVALTKPSAAECDGLSLRELTRADALALAAVESSAGADDDYAARLEGGAMCLALTEGDSVLGCMWVDFRWCRSWKSFALEANEAYLFDARVFHMHRGRGLAPLFRRMVYAHLRERGLVRFLSVTDALNRPAKRFKAKLGARPIKLYLLLRLFGRIDRVVTLWTFAGTRRSLDD